MDHIWLHISIPR